MRVILTFLAMMAASVARAECIASTDASFDCASREFQACQIIVNDRPRHYCQHVPNQGGALPVVFIFHGAGGKARALVNLWRSHTEQSVILVAPQALVTRRHDDCLPLWRQMGSEVSVWDDLDRDEPCSGGSFADDLDYVSALMDHFDDHYDVEHYYATGFSNGADFVFQLLMTKELAQRINGFATSGAGITRNRLLAMASGATTNGYSVNRDIRRPVLVHFGTEDKKNFDAQYFVAAVDENPDCGPITSAQSAMECFYTARPPAGVRQFDMPTRRKQTQAFLTRFNNVGAIRQESLYPNLGRGRDGDTTMTVRADYPRKIGESSAEVAVLTTIDGGHDWPGWGGNHAPCPSHNCDIDLTVEVINFWRSFADMHQPLP